jgi:hypothetical protein
MRKTIWLVAFLACAGTWFVNAARADDFSCLIIGGTQPYVSDLETSSFSIIVNGIEYDAYGTYDPDTGVGDFTFNKTLPIGQYSLPHAEFQFTSSTIPEHTIHGTFTGQTNPPTVLQAGCNPVQPNP